MTYLPNASQFITSSKHMHLFSPFSIKFHYYLCDVRVKEALHRTDFLLCSHQFLYLLSAYFIHNHPSSLVLAVPLKGTLNIDSWITHESLLWWSIEDFKCLKCYREQMQEEDFYIFRYYWKVRIWDNRFWAARTQIEGGGRLGAKSIKYN